MSLHPVMKTRFGNSSCTAIPLTYTTTVQPSSWQTRKPSVTKTSLSEFMGTGKIYYNHSLFNVNFKCYEYSRDVDTIILKWILEKYLVIM
jgi:hypothetical protein